MVASSVNVLVRARPLSQSEIDSGSEVILKMEKHKTFLNYIKDDKDDTTHRRESFSQKQFLFDRSYWSVDTSDEHFSDQCQIFNEYGKNVIKSAIDGYNACVFAYGQTGSGKTYTMMGTPNDLGIIPRICEGLFKQLIKMRAENITSRLEVSFMEIYNEQVHDLLQRKPKMFGQTATHSLKVREHPKEGPFVQDLSIHPVTDYSSVEALIDQGNSLRITAGTKMNALSSRSHSIFTLKMTQAKFCGNIPSETVSKVHLVDLAGSERIAKSGMTGIRLKEGANINKSLTTLGLVISALAENSSTQKSTGKIPRRQAFVPYRDSVLTWLLKDSIGGNSKTIMIATVSPSQIHYSETLSTLRYASRARKIVNKPIINEDPNVKTIRELRSEIEKLRKMLQDNTFEGPLTGKSKKVEAKLKENEEKVDKLTKHWLNKITEAQRIFKEKAMTLSQQGHQTVLTSAKPHLVGLEVDPLSTDIVIYHLEEGRTVIGSCNLSDEQGIALEGSGIAQEHCDLTVSRERVILHSIAGPTYINNTLVQQDWDLRQGDVLQFGHFLKFRFHNPIEAAALREKRRSGLFSQTASGRMSPAVMLHYRSLDSGLSSPDDFDQDFDQSQETEQVLNSTAASNNETPLNQRKMSEELQAPYRDVASDVTDRHNVVLFKDDDMKDDDMKDDDMKDVKPSDVVVRRRKQFLKSASASDVLSKSLSVAKATSDGNISFQLNSTKCSEIYLSADNLLSRRHTKKERDRHHFDILSSPPSVKHASSGSDLSLSTDDLAFNLMLQSQIRSTSSMSSLSGKGGKDRQSYPSLDSHTQSMWELSPRKYEEQNDDGDMFHCESLSVLHRRSFNGEEIIVHPDTSGSFLAREAKDAADLLKSRREQLKKLIEEYRSAEISRVEVEKENMRRGKDNEQIFAKQQSHLEDLIQQQHIRLNEAKFELREFQNLVSSEKQKQRENVEREVDHLMNLKQDHLPFLDWSEHELRKKKFKLKVKIEDYWKRMDLYETLWMELELERNQVKRDTDEKLQEKIKQFELQQTAEMNGLRDEIQRRQASVDTYTAQLEEQTAKQTQLSSDIASIDVDYTTKIREAERFRSDVKAQEATMLNECQLEIEELENEITKEKEKKFKYTIYNMHECDSPSCSSEHHEYADKELNCKLTEEKQQVVLNKLSLRKDELETKYNKKVDKYNLMLQNADHALAELREDRIVTVETKKQEIVYKKDLINKLENELKSETEQCRNLKNELKAFERPRSFISDCPEESEEDIIANEQQIEQLLQSKEKVCKTLEASLEKQFKELKEKRVLNGKEPLSGGETTTTAVDHALSLVLHAGNSSAYAESLVNKHTQYENRKKTLLNINNDLQDLMKYQMALHREVAENFLEQKSLFEEVRSQERKDIHDTIQTLISENTDDNDELLSRIFNESERIIAYQQKLDMLENQMYEKITQNHELQSKLDEIQEKLAEKSLGKQSTSENPKGGDPLPTIGNEIALTEEFDVIRTEKRKCEQLISELQQKLFEERKEYLELLKSKDDYDVIGPEYRDERRTMFQTEGNKAAAEILREIFMIGNLLDGMAKNPLSSDPTCGGWKYISVEKNVQIFKKKIEKTGAVSVLGRGIIKASPKLVWETVRNPLSRLIYDKMVKKMNVIENFTDQLKVVYFQHHARLFLLKHKKDCCCVHSERIEKNKYIASYRSVEHPDCPEKKNYSRLQIQPSGWVLEPHTENGEDWCLAWYVLQVDAGKGYIPSYFIDSLVQKLPLSISSLRDYLVLS